MMSDRHLRLLKSVREVGKANGVDTIESVLTVLALADTPKRVCELMKLTGLERPTVARICSRLAELGFVTYEETVNATNRNFVPKLTKLTDKGSELLYNLIEAMS